MTWQNIVLKTLYQKLCGDYDRKYLKSFNSLKHILEFWNVKTTLHRNFIFVRFNKVNLF